MTAEDLQVSVKRCQAQRSSADIREKIVYTTRLARFYGRLAVEFELSGRTDEAKKNEFQMEMQKQAALDLIGEFKAGWEPQERLFSVFANSYRLPDEISQAIEKDIMMENYRQRRPGFTQP